MQVLQQEGSLEEKTEVPQLKAKATEVKISFERVQKIREDEGKMRGSGDKIIR